MQGRMRLRELVEHVADPGTDRLPGTLRFGQHRPVTAAQAHGGAELVDECLSFELSSLGPGQVGIGLGADNLFVQLCETTPILTLRSVVEYGLVSGTDQNLALFARKVQDMEFGMR